MVQQFWSTPLLLDLFQWVIASFLFPVPDFSVATVRLFLKLLYTGQADFNGVHELRVVRNFCHNHLGFQMELEYNIITKNVIAENYQSSEVPMSKMSVSDSCPNDPGDATKKSDSVVRDKDEEEFALKVDLNVSQSIFTIRPSCEGLEVDTAVDDVPPEQDPVPIDKPSHEEDVQRYFQTCSG